MLCGSNVSQKLRAVGAHIAPRSRCCCCCRRRRCCCCCSCATCCGCCCRCCGTGSCAAAAAAVIRGKLDGLDGQRTVVIIIIIILAIIRFLTKVIFSLSHSLFFLQLVLPLTSASSFWSTSMMATSLMLTCMLYLPVCRWSYSTRPASLSLSSTDSTGCI